ncbi:MAG: dicarboxylate/amino acid:cation symporter [Parachlamydiaceae bacterium]|nr:dicarboxylate/amino acid:cation symporter [Parachlamydiaceae bacterium]
MKNAVLFKVLIAICLAIIAGWVTGTEAQLFGVPYVKFYGLIGQLFLNALMLVVVPLVTASIITGTARMGSEHSFGALGAKTFGYYILTSFLAIVVGVTVFFLIGTGGSGNLGLMGATALKGSALEAAAQGDAFDKIAQVLMRVVPSNIISAAAQGQILGLIGFCILFGIFLSKIEAQAASVVLNFWKGIFQIMMKITHFVMKALPIGVFGLVAKVVATTGADAFGSVAWFSVALIVGLLIFSLIVLPLMLALIAGVNPILHFRAMAPALFTAFSTSSSAASLPITIECVEQRAGVSNRICSFTVPLGTSLSMSGTAMHQTVASLFIAQAYGLELTLPIIFTVMFMGLLMSIGVAGIPSASLISVMIILPAIGVPVEGVGLIMAVERILDMCRTVVNVLGNTCCAVLVARSEGEKDVLVAHSLSNPKVTG